MRSLLLFILSFFTYHLQAQTINFDVFLFGDKVGYMTITREVKPGGIEHYVMETKAKARVLWINKDNHTRYDVTYQNGILQSSSIREVENGELIRWVNVMRDGAKYNVDGYKGKRTFTEAPEFSVVTTFFNMPQNVKRVFYEAEGTFSTFENPEPGTWQFKGSDGQKNVYHYVNGKIHHLEFHVSIATIKLVRTN